MGMNLYLLTQSVNNDYDTYDSMVVAAPNPETARHIHPFGRGTNQELLDSSTEEYQEARIFSVWAPVSNIKVELIGQSISDDIKIIIASFNAG